MPALGTYSEQLLLSFLLSGATATIPAHWGVGLSLGSPTSVNGSEIASGSGIARQSATFISAAVGSWTNTNAMSFGTNSASAVFSGVAVYDTYSVVYTANAGDLLLYGLLATARTLVSGDQISIPQGSM